MGRPADIVKIVKKISRWLRRSNDEALPYQISDEFPDLTLAQCEAIYAAAFGDGKRDAVALESQIYKIIEHDDELITRTRVTSSSHSLSGTTGAGPRKGKTRYLITFLDPQKRAVDNAHFTGERDDARREAIRLYAQHGDLHAYAGFVVTEEKHGGF
jgi:hypothetical protein